MEEQKFDGNTIEHLRMLQGIINRLANTSLGIKRYSLMVFTFVCGYLLISPAKKDIKLLALAVFIFTIMMLYDMYYLSMERAYRIKFNDNRDNKDDINLFDLSISKICLSSYIKTLVSKSIIVFYVPLLVTMIAIFHILK